MNDLEDETEETPLGWKEFLEDFTAQYAHPTEAGLTLNLSSEELESLGEFFVQGLVGWSLGIQMARRLPRRLIEVTPAPAAKEAHQKGEKREKEKRTIRPPFIDAPPGRGNDGTE